MPPVETTAPMRGADQEALPLEEAMAALDEHRMTLFPE